MRHAYGVGRLLCNTGDHPARRAFAVASDLCRFIHVAERSHQSLPAFTQPLIDAIVTFPGHRVSREE